jgi:uncharacterized DUF497 family protein
MAKDGFEWDSTKDHLNQLKHGVSFIEAQQAFLDPRRVIAEDLSHGNSESRYFCFGSFVGEILTVRFTYRNRKIRIFGAGFWRKGKKIYEQKNSIHR